MSHFFLIILLGLWTSKTSTATLLCALEKYTTYKQVAEYGKLCDFITPAKVQLDSKYFHHIHSVPGKTKSSINAESQTKRSYVIEMKKKNPKLKLILTVHLQTSHKNTSQTSINWKDFNELGAHYKVHQYSGIWLSSDEMTQTQSIETMIQALVDMKKEIKPPSKMILFVEIRKSENWNGMKLFAKDIDFFTIPSFVAEDHVIEIESRMRSPDYKSVFTSCGKLKLPEDKLFATLDLNLYEVLPGREKESKSLAVMRDYWEAIPFLKKISWSGEDRNGLKQGKLPSRKTEVKIDCIASIQKRIEYYRGKNVRNYVFYAPGPTPQSGLLDSILNTDIQDVKDVQIKAIDGILRNKNIAPFVQYEDYYLLGTNPIKTAPPITLF